MRLALTLLLLLLVSCAETPSKPTTSGGASSGSGKVVTATPEEPYECDSDLILEPHLPEECIPRSLLSLWCKSLWRRLNLTR